MEEKIDYSNPNLENKIKELFGNAYGVMQPILVDILLKRNYVFKLSNEESLDEAKRLLDNMESLEFGEIFSKASGYASLQNRKIKINDIFINNIPKIDAFLPMFYDTIVHEVFHILSFHYEYYDESTKKLVIENCTEENIKNSVNKTLCMGLCEVPERYSCAMMEAYNEAAASLFYNHNRNIYSAKDNGYGDLTFLPHLLSAAIGTTDNELIHAGIKSATEFNNVIFSQFKIFRKENNKKETDEDKHGDDYNIDDDIKRKLENVNVKDIIEELNRVVNAMNSIDENLNNIHSFTYGEDNFIYKTMSAMVLKKSSFESIISNAYYIANSQIKNDPRHVSKELLNELLVRYKKMDKSTSIAAKKLYIYNSNNFKEIKSGKEEMLNRIFGVYVVNQLEDKILDKDTLIKLTISAKKGEIFEFAEEIKKSYGVDLEELKQNDFIKYIKSEEYKNSEYYHKLEKDDMYNYKKWDMKRDFDNIRDFCKAISKESSNFKKSYISLIKRPYELMGLAFSRSELTYDSIVDSIAKGKISKEIGISEDTITLFYEALQEQRMQCNEELKSIACVHQKNGEITKYNSKTIMTFFGDYYTNYLKLICNKNEGIEQNFSTKEVLRSAIGKRNIKKYFNKNLKKFKKYEVLSAEEIETFNKNNEEFEDYLDNQIKQLYVLAKLKDSGEYEPTDRDICEALDRNLFSKKVQSNGINFESYFDESEFNKEVQKQHRIDNWLMPFENLRTIPQQFVQIFKRVEALPEGKEEKSEALLLEENENHQNDKNNKSFKERMQVDSKNLSEDLSDNNNEKGFEDKKRKINKTNIERMENL